MKKSLITIGIIFAVLLTLGSIHAEDAANTTFSDLSNQISEIQVGEVVNLSNEYKFDPQTDNNYVDGVTVSKDMIIKGNNTVIDGNGKARALYIKSGCNVVVENITFKNCFSESDGAGIELCKNSNLVLKNCIFINNKVYNANGGAINSHTSTNITAYNCVFKYNNAIRESNLEWEEFKRGLGSAFCIGINSNLNLYDCTLANNKGYLSTVAVISNSIEGHMVSKLYAKNCLFENNTSNAHTAIYIDELGKCEVISSIFRNNRATTGSSIIDLDGTISSVFKKCLFESNSGVKGGVFYIFPHGSTKGTVTISDSTFNKNTASEMGGAIYSNSAALTLTNNQFNQNTAKDSGGAVMVHKGTVKLTNCIFNKNKASKGGAAVFSCDNVVMSKCKFTSNEASKFGGAIYSNANKMTFTDNTFNQNTAKDSGGAINIYKGTVKLTNCIFNKNKAPKGGAAVFAGDNAIMSKCKFTSNTATKFGGAIYQKVKKHTVSKCTYNGNKAPKSKDVYDKIKVYVKQTSKKRGNVKLKIKVGSSWNVPHNQKILLKFKGPRFFKTGWIKLPAKGALNLKVPVKLKRGIYKLVVSMNGEYCKYNSLKVKVV